MQIKKLYGIFHLQNIKEEANLKSGIKSLATWLIIGIILIVVISSILDNNNSKMKYSELIANIEEGNVESIYEYYTYINSNEDVRNAARKIWPNTGGGGDAPTPSVSNDFYIEFNGNKLDESSSMVGYTSANLLYYKGSAENVCVNGFYIPMNDYFPTTPFLFRKKDSNSYIPYTDIEIYIGSLPGIGVPLSYSYTGDGKSIVFNLLVSNSSFYLPNLSYGRVYSYIKFRQKSTGASKVWVTIFYKSSLYRTIIR